MATFALRERPLGHKHTLVYPCARAQCALARLVAQVVKKADVPDKEDVDALLEEVVSASRASFNRRP